MWPGMGGTSMSIFKLGGGTNEVEVDAMVTSDLTGTMGGASMSIGSPSSEGASRSAPSRVILLRIV